MKRYLAILKHILNPDRKIFKKSPTGQEILESVMIAGALHATKMHSQGSVRLQMGLIDEHYLLGNYLDDSAHHSK